MEKIPTMFERGPDGKVIDVPTGSWDPNLQVAATRKLNGTNVRVTVRKGFIVRTEIRRNPSKEQKEEGILTPWYRDVFDPGDKWIIEASAQTFMENYPDGEYCGEALGPKIQGNPHKLEKHTIIPFHSGVLLGQLLILPQPPTDFEGLKDLLTSETWDSEDAEGIVWWDTENWRPLCKIKGKDFA